MANTSALGREVEEYVRAALSEQFGQAFTKEKLRLASGGDFCFDAVSADRKIVACVKSSRGTTRGGKPTTGAQKAAIADLYYLSLIDANTRLLVVTDEGFHRRLKKALTGRIAPGIEIRFLPLPAELARVAESTLDGASKEMPSRFELAARDASGEFLDETSGRSSERS